MEVVVHNMVQYGDAFIDHPTADMYSKHYSPTHAAFSAATTNTYDSTAYHTAPAHTTSHADSVPYYDHGYRPTYWQQPQNVKDETGLAAYQQGGWSAYQNRDMDMYKQHPEYFTLQNPSHGHSLGQQSPSGVAMQYAPCAMMPTIGQSQAMEDEMVKEQGQGYNGWITGSVGTNCKTRTKDKYRVVYSDHQRLELEKEFHYSRYITIRRKAELAVNLHLSERQVKIWFQNRRAKERKMNRKKSGEDSKSATEGESRSSPCSSDAEEGEVVDTTTHGLAL